jgi:hypothetical protein
MLPLPLARDGAVCATVRDCASGHCVDGVCGATACRGACERCDGEDAAGQCVQTECEVATDCVPGVFDSANFDDSCYQ